MMKAFSYSILIHSLDAPGRRPVRLTPYTSGSQSPVHAKQTTFSIKYFRRFSVKQLKMVSVHVEFGKILVSDMRLAMKWTG